MLEQIQPAWFTFKKALGMIDSRPLVQIPFSRWNHIRSFAPLLFRYHTSSAWAAKSVVRGVRFLRTHLQTLATMVAPGVCSDAGVAPDNYHGTSNHPEYIQTRRGHWHLARESRMDCVVVLRGDDVDIVEARRLKKGDAAVVGRTENACDAHYFRNSSITGMATSGFTTGRERVIWPCLLRCVSTPGSNSRKRTSDASCRNWAYSTFPARSSR